jgi:hypothetical protein
MQFKNSRSRRLMIDMQYVPSTFDARIHVLNKNTQAKISHFYKIHDRMRDRYEQDVVDQVVHAVVLLKKSELGQQTIGNQQISSKKIANTDLKAESPLIKDTDTRIKGSEKN